MPLRVLRRNVVRLLATSIAAVTMSIAGVTFVATSALADTGSMEAQFIAKMNAARESAGLRPYAVASDLTAVARSHSREMASRQQLYHNPNLTSDVQNWQAVGENVGEGPTVSDIHTAFMNSPEHRANILDHDFTQVGVGVTVDSNGTIWVTEDFRQPMHSSSSTPTRSSGSTGRTTSTRTTSTHRTTSTRHAVTTPVRHPAHVPGPVAHAARPVPAQTPQAVLLARLTALRTAAAHATTADPVSAAFDYLNNVTTLTSTT